MSSSLFAPYWPFQSHVSCPFFCISLAKRQSSVPLPNSTYSPHWNLSNLFKCKLGWTTFPNLLYISLWMAPHSSYSKLHNMLYKTSYSLHPMSISGLPSLLFIYTEILVLYLHSSWCFWFMSVSSLPGMSPVLSFKPNSYLFFKGSSQVAPPPELSLKSDIGSKTQILFFGILKNFTSIFYCGINT